MMQFYHKSAVVFLSLALTSLLVPSASFNINLPTKARTAAATSQDLPKIDPSNPDRFLPPASQGNINKSFYSLPETLVRAGPVPLITRVAQPDKYEQSVLRYMYEARVTDVTDAQGNMDAFFKAPDVWAEQKMLEQRGDREVFDYGKSPSFDRIVLATVWGIFVSGLLGRVIWQLIHGNKNLF